MKVLVTGASGFLGRFVVAELLRRGHDVAALARSDQAERKVAALGAEAVRGDLDHPDELASAFGSAKAEVLANLASLGFGHAPAIVGAAGRAGLDRALFVSTTAIFTSLNAPSKAVRMDAERAIEASGLDWTILRPTMIYGAPGDRNIERLLRVLRWAPVIPLPAGGRGAIQPVHVVDLARFVVSALEIDRTVHRAFNVAGPEPLPLRRAVGEAARAVGRKPLLLPVPLRPVQGAVGVYEHMVRRPRLKAEQVLRLGEDKAFAIDDASALGYQPRPFARGVAEEAAALGLA